MTAPLVFCTTCGAANAKQDAFCSICGQVLSLPESATGMLPAPAFLEEHRIQPARRFRLARRRMIAGLAGVAVLAALGAPFLITAIQNNLHAIQSQEVTITQDSPDHLLTLVTWSPDGKRLATCEDTGKVQIWNIANSKCIMSFNGLLDQPNDLQMTNAYIAGINWSPDGRYIALANGPASIWDAKTGKHICSLSLSRNGSGLKAVYIAWSPDGQYIATGDTDGTIQKGNTRINIWATNGWVRVKQLSGPYDALSSMAWLSDSKKLLIAGDISANVALQSDVQIWDIGTDTPLLLKKADYPDKTYGATWSPDGTYFAVNATGENNGSRIRVYNTAGKFQTFYASKDQSNLVAMAWSPANRIAAVFGPSRPDSNMTVYIWDASNGRLISTSTSAQNADQGGWDEYCFAWSPDGKRVAYTSASTLVVWQPG